jgi:hypothetical protein
MESPALSHHGRAGTPFHPLILSAYAWMFKIANTWMGEPGVVVVEGMKDAFQKYKNLTVKASGRRLRHHIIYLNKLFTLPRQQDVICSF